MICMSNISTFLKCHRNKYISALFKCKLSYVHFSSRSDWSHYGVSVIPNVYSFYVCHQVRHNLIIMLKNSIWIIMFLYWSEGVKSKCNMRQEAFKWVLKVPVFLPYFFTSLWVNYHSEFCVQKITKPD